MALSFEEDLRQVLNRHSAEVVSGTPDYLLADLLVGVLKVYNDVVNKRAEWRGESVDLTIKEEKYKSPLSKRQQEALWQQIGALYNFSPASEEGCHELEAVVARIAEGSL